MNQREVLLDRCRASPRIRRLAASAIVSGVSIHCRQTIDMNVAEVLAVRLTPTEAVKRFVEQAAVRRRNMTAKELEIYRVYLVTKEAIEVGGSGVPDLEKPREEELLARLRAGQRAISLAERTHDEMEHLGACLEQSGPSRRRFYRRADRLWRQQRSRLKAAVHDPGHYEAALSDLGAVYIRVFRELVGQDD